MQTLMSGLSLLFSKKRYLALFLLLLALLIPLYSILTGILLFPSLTLNPNMRFFEASLVILVSILASLGFTIVGYQAFELGILSKKTFSGGILGAGAGGSIIASFGSACGVCQPVWMMWLGIGGGLPIFVDYSAYILAISLGLLSFSIYLGLKTISSKCAIR